MVFVQIVWAAEIEEKQAINKTNICINIVQSISFRPKESGCTRQQFGKCWHIKRLKNHR